MHARTLARRRDDANAGRAGACGDTCARADTYSDVRADLVVGSDAARPCRYDDPRLHDG
jgi:hypothetical protein